MLHSRLFIYMRGISSQTVYSVSSFTVLNMEALFDSVKSSIVLDVELKMEQKSYGGLLMKKNVFVEKNLKQRTQLSIANYFVMLYI